LSGDQARQAAEDEVPDRLIGRAAWQMDLDLGFHLDDASGGLDQAQPPLSSKLRPSSSTGSQAKRWPDQALQFRVVALQPVVEIDTPQRQEREGEQ
jgi:hypothetical protein